MLSTNLLPLDATQEEVLILSEIKHIMLRKLKTDRSRFVFVYVIDLGNSQREAARAMGVHETEVSRQLRYIRQQLQDFKKGYV